MKSLSSVLAPLVLIVVLVIGWDLTCRLLAVPTYVMPPPMAVFHALVDNAALLTTSALRTLAMALFALLLAAVCACALALVGGLSPTIERAVKPLAVTLQVTPVVAIAPLVVIWMGLDHPDRAIVTLAAVVAFFPIYSGAVTGLASADPDLERLFDLYGATRVQRLLRLRLPAATPFLLEGVKVASGLSVIGAVVAEFVAGSGGAQGLAWRIIESYNRLQTARMFAALFALAVLAVLLNGLFQLAERKLLVWWRGR